MTTRRYQYLLRWGVASLLSIVLVVALAIGLNRSRGDGHPAFHDSFLTAGGSSLRESWQPFGGTWQISNGTMMNISDDRGAKLLNGSTKWSNYAVEADVELLGEAGDAGFILRSSQEDVGVDAYHGYFAGLRNLDDTLILGRADFGWHQFRKIPVRTSLETHTWYHLKFLAYDCWLVATAADGRGMLAKASTKDHDCLTQGRFGLQSYSIAAAWRNVNVYPSTKADLDSVLGTVSDTSSGTSTSAHDRANAWTDPRMLEPMLRELEGHKSDLNALPIAQLRLLAPDSASRITIHGVVTMISPELFVQDPSGGLIISTYSSNTPLQIGDTVEATGAAELHDYSTALHDAHVRLISSHASIPPVSITAARAASGDFDAQFIETEGRLTGRAQNGDRSIVLTLEEGSQSFLAYVQNPSLTTYLTSFRIGSHLRVRGICVTDRTYARNEMPFAILMQSPKDATMLEPPPWWNKLHIVELCATLILLSFALQYALVSIKRSQSHAVMEERERLAMEMHDTLAQSFAGIGFRLEALSADAVDHPALHSQLQKTVDLIRFGHREARRNIAALRPGNLEKLGLMKSIEIAAHSIIQNGLVQIHLSMRGEEQTIPLRISDPLLRISQEAITNAVRHGHPKNIHISLMFGRHSVRLRIRDDGEGFSQNDDASGFGIRGMTQRAEAIGAAFRLFTLPGHGTTILVRARLPTTVLSQKLWRAMKKIQWRRRLYG